MSSPERKRDATFLQPENLVLGPISGKDYEIPGKVPLTAILRMIRLQQRIESAGNDIGVIGESLQGLLESGDPDEPGIMELFRAVPGQEDIKLPLDLDDVLRIIELLMEKMGVSRSAEPQATAEPGEPDDEPVEDAAPLVGASSPSG